MIDNSRNNVVGGSGVVVSLCVKDFFGFLAFVFGVGEGGGERGGR